ncbi:MAG: cobyrinate a,c-diamide synthase [Deferribacteraceae bacterium]|jgi:cobyrinic acid a,c-diamide synthase|nr:cobyrinate a,c-diamide synthase [Deferribacteraceae bacterium]
MFAFMMSAYCSGSGKTVITSGISRALTGRGLRIAPYKCGPDYIDTIWQSKAAGSPAYNLDSVLLDEEDVPELFSRTSAGFDGAVTEGVMGFFDGADPVTFLGSSYHIAKILEIPVIIIIDAGNLAAGAAAIVAGIQKLAPEIKLAGVILNKTRSYRQESLLSKAITAHTPDIPILGALPVDETLSVPSRYMGLSTDNTDNTETFFEKAAETVKKYIDLDRILPLTEYITNKSTKENVKLQGNKTKTALIAYDDAFCFYYRSTFDLLEHYGYKIQTFSPLADESFDTADLLLLGGGYPELYADKLSAAKNAKRSVSRHHSDGRPVFAEGGGVIYLSKSLKTETGLYPMTGIFDTDYEMTAKRRRLGYVRHTYTNMPGHIFHYSRVSDNREPYLGEAQRVNGEESYPDGFLKRRVYGGYTHFMPTEKSNFFSNFIKGVG